MMLKGIYVFKQNGIEIGRSENIITDNGKKSILKYLTNSISEWASSIAVGAIPTTAASSDKTLYYEIARSAVTMKSYRSGTPNLIIVKSTLDASVAANIYEIGVYPNTTSQIFGTRDQMILTDFSYYYDWLKTAGSGTVSNTPFIPQDPYSPRVGFNSIKLPAATTISNSNFSLNLSSYTSTDTLDILVNVPVTSTGSNTLNLTLTDVNGLTSIASYSYNASTTSGYQVLSTNLASNINTLSTIKTITIQSVGTNSAITLDAIRVSVTSEVGDSSSLVSRSVLTTPIAKIYGTPLDIEYYLQLS